ncbi:hypothetical protein [uncultured Anaeromusa sp.]|uniref:hypothetical protein n=1 Tax=uncultured Anaeromusa sp. TaxID=673273 RepID=UPI0029C64387|nr:hypothetical protein [uncultured Anaeromusa sp.]
MNKTYEWTTPKGAKVSMTISMVSEQKQYDGIEYTGKPELKISSLTVNGQSFKAEFGTLQHIGFAMFKVGTKQAAVEMPQEAKDDLDAYWTKKVNDKLEAERSYKAETAKVYRAMNA